MSDVSRTLPLVIAEHIAWLRAHGETVAGHNGWEPAESVDARAFASTGGEFCFAAEREPLTQQELETAIARMDYARADLLAAIEPLPDMILDWEPPASAIVSFDAWAPEVRTIRDIVEHVLQLKVYYRDGLHDGPARGIFEQVADPTTERAQTLDLLWSLAEAGDERVYRPLRPSRSVAEEWTVRKLLRRIIAHERAHTAEVAQRRTWLLLGVPGPAGR